MCTYLEQEFSLEQIAAMIAAHEPWPVESLRRITTGKYNTSYVVTLRRNGRTGRPGAVIVRIAPPPDTGGTFYENGMMAQEPRIHEIVRRATSLPVAEIYAFDASRRIIDRDFMIMQKLPGAALSEVPGVTTTLYNGVLEQVGRMLAELHGVTSDHYGYVGPHRPMPPQPDWPSAFRIMWNKLTDDIVCVQAYTAEEERRVRRLFEDYMFVFERPIEASLLHMDIWAQNILVDDEGRVTGLVDWDRALWGDPEIEFAVLDYCGISEPAFWRGYGRPRDRSTEAHIRSLFYYLYEVQKYIVIHLARRQSRTWHIYKTRVMEIVGQAFRE